MVLIRVGLPPRIDRDALDIWAFPVRDVGVGGEGRQTLGVGGVAADVNFEAVESGL